MAQALRVVIFQPARPRVCRGRRGSRGSRRRTSPSLPPPIPRRAGSGRSPRRAVVGAGEGGARQREGEGVGGLEPAAAKKPRARPARSTFRPSSAKSPGGSRQSASPKEASCPCGRAAGVEKVGREGAPRRDGLAVGRKLCGAEDAALPCRAGEADGVMPLAAHAVRVQLDLLALHKIGVGGRKAGGVVLILLARKRCTSNRRARRPGRACAPRSPKFSPGGRRTSARSARSTRRRRPALFAQHPLPRAGRVDEDLVEIPFKAVGEGRRGRRR